MLKPPNIDIKVRAKIKKLDIYEWDMVLNVWRASMLFFERELRKMSDKDELSKVTLLKIAEKIDFTDILRLTFTTIPDDKRMRLVKLAEVSEALQRMREYPASVPQQDLVNSVVDYPETPQQYTSDSYIPSPTYETTPIETQRMFTQPSTSPRTIDSFNTLPQTKEPTSISPDSTQIQSQPAIEPEKATSQPQTPPQPSIDISDLNENDISVQDHLDVLQKNTASAVIELRRMMYENLQNLKKQLEE